MFKRVMVLCVVLLTVSALAFAAGTQENSAQQETEHEKLIVICHKVHEDIAKGSTGTGGSLVQEFEKTRNVEVLYQTYPTSQVGEKYNQLGPLKDCGADIIYLLDGMYTSGDMPRFLEPLDAYLERSPVDGFPKQWPPSNVELGTAAGSLYVIPIRLGNFGLWYNAKIFEERGISGPPKTPEELYEIAKKCTYTRSDGEKVFGWVCRGSVSNIADYLTPMVRMWDGEFLTYDFKVTVNERPAVAALRLLQNMYREGIMPPDWPTYDHPEATRLFQEGRAAMGLFATSYGPTFNDPAKSRVAGSVMVTTMPLAQELQSQKRDFSVGSVFAWGVAIFKGAKNKDLAWEFIRFLSSKESHLRMGLSGNSPARIDVMQDPAYQETAMGASVDSLMAPYTRGSFPAFANLNQVADIIGRHIHEVVVGGKSVQEEMDKARNEILPLMPK